jgi:hypothetical protein
MKRMPSFATGKAAAATIVCAENGFISSRKVRYK